MEVFINPPKEQWASLLQRPVLPGNDLDQKVRSILEDVKLNGDNAIKKYAAQFDGVVLDDLLVPEVEISAAAGLVDDDLKKAIDIAGTNLFAFHNAQKESVNKIETMPGVSCWRKSVPIEKVGFYIPGGSAPLFSTLLMLGIPAMIAGCKEVVVCTPCGKDGKVNPVLLYIADLFRITKIFRIGGVQAIAAMAYGTATIPKVFKIFGPGNQYVTCAKQLVSNEGVAIDMPAGPSEVAVYADESSHPEFVAADLLSQAEHGPDSQVLLVAKTNLVLASIKKELIVQLENLPRKDFAAASLKNSKLIVMRDDNAAFELLNEYAPEHLIIASDRAGEMADKVTTAGSVFLGHYAPEAVGDYASGTNHTLPTNGYARAYSGISLDSFVKKISFQQLTTQGLQNLASTVELMAEAEGLAAHRNAVTIRMNKFKNDTDAI